MDQHRDIDGSSHDPVGGGAAANGAGGDPLLAIRAELDSVEELPLEQRAAVFERTHAIVVEELRALELG